MAWKPLRQKRLRLPTLGAKVGKPGPRATFRVKSATSFPALRSQRRQVLLETILQAPLGRVCGAGCACC